MFCGSVYWMNAITIMTKNTNITNNNDTETLQYIDFQLLTNPDRISPYLWDYGERNYLLWSVSMPVIILPQDTRANL